MPFWFTTESHSLRDVGAAFGVSEDTAQKRVQSALEKLAEFFEHHGFRTATLAATAAGTRPRAPDPLRVRSQAQ